jgi:hypothetical protein
LDHDGMLPDALDRTCEEFKLRAVMAGKRHAQPKRLLCALGKLYRPIGDRFRRNMLGGHQSRRETFKARMQLRRRACML